MAEVQEAGSAPVQKGRNPQYEKALVRQVLHTASFRRLPVRRYEIGGKGKQRIIRLFTVKPTAFTEETKTRLKDALAAKFGKEITLELVPEAYSQAKMVRRTPMKVRHVLQLIRGKNVAQSLAVLQFTPNFAAKDIYKVLKSAAANAEMGWGASPEELVVSECYADCAGRMKRYRPGPMGRARPILKLLSHITVVVSESGDRR
jgi:large subunit ribosomal protein L22